MIGIVRDLLHELTNDQLRKKLTAEGISCDSLSAETRGSYIEQLLLRYERKEQDLPPEADISSDPPETPIMTALI